MPYSIALFPVGTLRSAVQGSAPTFALSESNDGRGTGLGTVQRMMHV